MSWNPQQMCTACKRKRCFYWKTERYWSLHFNCIDRNYYPVIFFIKNLSNNRSLSSPSFICHFCMLYEVLFFFQILGILCMSLASPAYLSGTHFFLFVATTTFIGTLIWIFVYLLSIREALNLPINWILTVSRYTVILN